MTWPTVKLGDIVQLITKGTTPTTLGNKFTDAGVGFVRAQNIIAGSISFERDSLFISEDTHHLLKRSQICAGDVLVAIAGTIGRVGIVPDTFDKLNCNQAVAIIRVDKNITNRFLLHWLSSTHAVSQIKSSTVVGVISNLSLSQIANLKIHLPPLAEQQRIAAILDKAEEIKRKREQAIAKLDELAQSAFDHMFNQNKNLKKLKLIDLVQKKKLLDKNEDTDQTKVWNLTLDQIESDGGDINGFVQVGKSEIGNSTYYFEPPVVLYSKLRPYLNKVVMPEKDGYATTELVPLYCNEELISPIFLLNYLKSKSFVAFANTNSGGAKMPRVMMDKFWSHEIKVPSKLEQKEFEQVYDQIKTQKAIQKNNLITQDLLLSSLQDQAFSTGFNA